MYPSLLRDREFPVALGPVYGALSVAALLDCCRSGGVLARVTVDTCAPEYPRRTKDGCDYPVGRWVACLTGPELLALHEAPGHGRVLACHECATYRMGTPFRASMDVLLSARANATSGDDKTFAKLLANSVAGRLAMRAGSWKRHPDLDGVQEWGEEPVISATDGRIRRYRWMLGVCWVHDPEREPQGPHTSAFAYLTAYGRIMMRQIRDMMPARSVYAQHTDGLYCSWEGLRSLSAAGMLRAKGAGALRLVGSRCTAQFWGASHYRFGEDWTLAGYSSAHVSERDGCVYISRRCGMFGEKHRDAPTTVRAHRLKVALPTTAEGCAIGSDGWALPAPTESLTRGSVT